MAFGPAICACCGSREGVETHHLYSRSAGCPDDLTVWLCGVCHRRTFDRRSLHSAVHRTRKASLWAKGVLPIIEDIRAAGITSANGIAKALNDRGISTVRGRPWKAVQVLRVLEKSAG